MAELKLLKNLEILQFLESLRRRLLRKANRHKIEMTRKWVSKFTKEAGVYALIEHNLIVYAGESGSLKKRMGHLLITQQHIVRRTIGAKYYSHIKGYKAATERKPFPPHIERCVNKHLSSKFTLAIMEVPLGRKELEEYIVDKIFLETRLNKRTKSRMLEGPSYKAKKVLQKVKT